MTRQLKSSATKRSSTLSSRKNSQSTQLPAGRMTGKNYSRSLSKRSNPATPTRRKAATRNPAQAVSPFSSAQLCSRGSRAGRITRRTRRKCRATSWTASATASPTRSCGTISTRFCSI
ncbi:unnamed protein product [Amoebophrya sp. A120]|nr:unnamed protein product [Amoebophrya sp. A120]|eukprot:GSA120T00018653001.1